MKKRRFDEGGDVGYDFETTTDEEGNEVAVARKGYSPRTADTAPKATRATKAVSKPAARPVSSSKPSADYVSAARNKYKEAQGYDEASKNKNLSAEDRRAMLGRYAQAMKDYDTLGRASKYAEGKGMKRGGSVKSSASRRADGIAVKGKTKGRII